MHLVFLEILTIGGFEIGIFFLIRNFYFFALMQKSNKKNQSAAAD